MNTDTEPKILASRERTHRVSTWTEHLTCATSSTTGKTR
jgi:hypothetical protein